MTIDYCISPPQYDLPDLPQYHLPELRGRRGPDSGIYTSLRQAENAPVRSSGPTGRAKDAEKRTLLFKRNRQYQAEGKQKTEGSKQ